MEAALRDGARALGLELSGPQLSQLAEYAGLLQKWSLVYNLTAIRDADDLLTHHLLDCLAIVAPMRDTCPGADRILDVGSGAGLPGVVLAIACPNLTVDCLDAVAKKAAFVQQVAMTLRLPNLRGVKARIEDWEETYPAVTSRAFASLADFVRLTSRCVEEGGVWLAMKGKYPADELSTLPVDIEMFHVEQLQVPGLHADRCLIWLRRRAGGL